MRLDHEPIDPRILPLHLMSSDMRRNVLWYSERERSAGWVAGYDHAQREFWRLPPYEAAVKNCIDLGSLGIDRREADRRKREVSL